MADFIIFLRPDTVAYTCPHCAAYTEVPWDSVEDEAPDDWGGGDWPDVVCPECRGKVSLDKDPLMWKKVPRSQRWEEKHDLISRKTAIDAILAEPPYAPQSWYEGVIRNLPASGVEPVRHGRWEARPTGMATDTGYPEYKAYCTVCNEPNKQYQPPFCPHCGAKMDGGADNG